jgi:GINS complex subunit 3
MPAFPIDIQLPKPPITRTNANKIQKLPCTFELEVPGLGILEGNPGEDVCIPLPPHLTIDRVNQHQIKAGTRIDLPLWLGEMLSIG